MARQSNRELLEEYVDSLEQFRTDRDIDIKLAKGQSSYEYVIISELNLGAKDNKPAIKKLLKQIQFVKENDKAFVVLGGNLISYTKDSREMLKYAKVIAGALEPIKDKIVLAYYGPEEVRYTKAKEPLHPLHHIIRALKLNPNKLIRENNAVINVQIENTKTKKPILVRDRFVAIKSTAQTFSSEGNNIYKVVGNPGSYDNIFVTCCNNSGVFRKAIMRPSYSGNNDQIEKHSFNVVLDSGYKLKMKTPGNRISRFNFVDKYSYMITISDNKDASRVVGKDTLTEEPYKTFISRHVIDAVKTQNDIKQLTNTYLNIKKSNEFKARWLMDEIQKKLHNINETNLQTLIDQKKTIETKTDAKEPVRER